MMVNTAINKANASVVVTFTGGSQSGYGQIIGQYTAVSGPSTKTVYSWSATSTDPITLPYGNSNFTIASMNECPEFAHNFSSSSVSKSVYSIKIANYGINVSGSGSGTLTIYGGFKSESATAITVYTNTNIKPYIKLQISNGQLTSISHNLCVYVVGSLGTSSMYLYLRSIESIVWE